MLQQQQSVSSSAWFERLFPNGEPSLETLRLLTTELGQYGHRLYPELVCPLFKGVRGAMRRISAEFEITHETFLRDVVTGKACWYQDRLVEIVDGDIMQAAPHLRQEKRALMLMIQAAANIICKATGFCPEEQKIAPCDEGGEDGMYTEVP